MRFRHLSALLLLALAPLAAYGEGQAHRSGGDLSATLKNEVRAAIDQHLSDVKAPREATVLEMAPADDSTVRVCVWMPGDDQPTRLPRLVSYRYAMPSGVVTPED